MDNQQLMTIWLSAVGLVILLIGLWTWYQYVHRSAYGVFWGTVDNNFSIFGVTRSIEQTNNGAKVDQKLQISLGAENLAHGLTTITQPGRDGRPTTVVTETLGTPSGNYARYTQIKTGALQQPDISKVKDVWSREPLTSGSKQNQSIFAEGLFSSIPFANLNRTQRQELIQFMKNNKVYDVDYRGAEVVERAGKQGYKYEVTVNLKSYIATLKKIDELMGLGQLKSVDPASYENAPPANLIVVNSIDGRQLLEVTYTGTNRQEKYSSYGARINIDVPETNLLRSDLEQKVQSIFKPASGT